MYLLLFSWIIVSLVYFLFSYGFVDPNLILFHTPALAAAMGMLRQFVYGSSRWAAAVYGTLITVCFVLFPLAVRAFKNAKQPSLIRVLIIPFALFVFSYPALSYDIFNYILTAKVAFIHHENPYIVMPIEIPNEPMLAYTRAANKLALYGPVWIASTFVPHIISSGNILAAIYSFKLFAAAWYLAMCLIIFRKTKRREQVAWFALNPLVLVETLSNGHNDIMMMVLGVAALLVWERKGFRSRIAGLVLLAFSVLVKGATVALIPLFALEEWRWVRKAALGVFLMLSIFAVSPLREEMYPWYGVWWLAFAAFVPIRKGSFIHGLSYWMSLGLMLRYVPWIATREYGGITPLARVIVTAVPVAGYIGMYVIRKYLGAKRVCTG